MNFAQDFGIDLEGTIHIDASAALAISQRQGLGKLRHINVHWLWIQERIKSGDLSAHKVYGKDNTAELITKHFSGEEISRHLSAMNFEVATGKADKSLILNQVTGAIAESEGIDEPRTSECLLPSGSDREAVQDCHHWSHDEQCVIRRHVKPRRMLYDPFQCKGARKLGSLTSIRVTHGRFEDGTEFTRQDNWICKSVKSLDMGQPWVGRTIFTPKISVKHFGSFLGSISRCDEFQAHTQCNQIAEKMSRSTFVPFGAL